MLSTSKEPWVFKEPVLPIETAVLREMSTTNVRFLREQDFDRDSNVIEVFVGRLRRKLDPDNRYNPIETLRGRGYRLTLERTSL